MLSSAFSHHHVALSLLPLCRCTAMRLPFPEHVQHYLTVLESSSQEGSIHRNTCEGIMHDYIQLHEIMIIYNDTLSESNIAPENQGLEDAFPFGVA